MHYYQFNIGDYASSTQHLDPLEDLAYRRMLDLYYQKEKPLPKDIKEIARLIRMRPHCECIELVLQDFFTLTADGYTNHGADKVLGKTYEKSEKAKKAAEARWNKNKDLADADAMQTHSEKNADAMPPNTQYPIPNTHNKDLLSESSDAISVLTYLNEVCSSKYKHSTKSHIENINARLSEGHSVDDCRLVIDAKFKDWSGDQKMSAYLRPSTLFSAGKFQGYLMAAKSKPSKSNHDLSDIEYTSGSF